MEGDRLRSFLERYVIARASSFVKGQEREEAWAAMLDAKTIYGQIGEQGRMADAHEHAVNQSGATPGIIAHPSGRTRFDWPPVGGGGSGVVSGPMALNKPVPAVPSLAAPSPPEASKRTGLLGILGRRA